LSDSNSLIGISNRLSDVVVLVVSVAHQGRSDDVLVTFHEDRVADTEFVSEVLRLLMTDDVRNSAISFNLNQSSFKPFDVSSGVILVGRHVPVLRVRGISLDYDDFAAFKLRAISQLKGQGAVAILLEFDGGFRCHKFRPVLIEVVDRVVDIWLTHVLHINGPSVMIPSGEVDWDSTVTKDICKLLNDQSSVVSNLLFSVIPGVMGAAITSVEDTVNLLVGLFDVV